MENDLLSFIMDISILLLLSLYVYLLWEALY